MRTILPFILMVLSINISAQSIDSNNLVLQNLIEKKVDEVINETEYVRIPRKDFEEIIENRITNLLDSRVQTLVGFLVAIIGILSTLSLIQFNRSRNLLKEQVLAQVNSDLNEKSNELRKTFDESINTRLEDIERRLIDKAELDFKRTTESFKQVDEQLIQSTNQIKKAEEYLFNIEYEDVKKQVSLGQKKYDYQTTLDRAISILNTAEEESKNDLIPNIVNILTYIYYDYNKYNEVNDLLAKYEGKTKLLSTSYVNAALTGIFDYHNYDSIPQRNKALVYLDKSLELTSGYGQAHALKLEIHMMDYIRTDDEEKRNEIVKECETILNHILNSASPAPAFETMSRLVQDEKTSESYANLVRKLLELFPEKLKTIGERAAEYEKRRNAK